MERRRHARYNLRLPVLFSWYSAPCERVEDGWTADISTHGVHVVCKPECCPPVGKRLTINLALPTREATRPGVTLRGQGKVLRLGPTSDKWASFAAATHFKLEPH